MGWPRASRLNLGGVLMSFGVRRQGDADEPPHNSDEMGGLANISDGMNLHGRTLLSAMEVIERLNVAKPDLAEIAAAMDHPLDEISAIFPDADAVLVGAAEQALVRLIDACVKAVVKVDPDDAVAQFGALGEAYIDWAISYPTQFRMISDPRMLDTLGTPRLRRYLDSLTELMTRMLERARDSGHLAEDENIPLMILSSRTFAYGLASMVIDQRMAEWYPHVAPIEAAKTALHDFIYRFARGSTRRQR